jgi:SOS regulatory protein LexA
MKSIYQNKIESFYHREKRMPTYTEMMKLFDFKSKNAVAKLVNKMLAAGVVAKDHLGRLIPTANFGEIPMAGFVKAGLPAEAEELTDTVSLEDMLVGKKELTYMLEVDGDSMIDAHIAEGDMVLVERTTNEQAKEGDIVIAEVDGEFTMKYLRKKEGKFYLQPANKNYKNIYPEQTLNIVGKVKAVIRKY